MPGESKTPRKVVELTPEKAGEMLFELDTTGAYYYTKGKRRDPFEELMDSGVDIV